ncbi:hypothetical protein [Magnetospirillum gryphiswaldense]|uniref:hypothetical protein n=1 Tax=Magnetospirillum gryphiswaldense TaxID=55518 RepID=UPI0018D41937|nr:hypothetical protein [Magnetospirillum gryphiswaldense]
MIKVVTQNRPDVLAAISPDETIDMAIAIRYREQFPELDFMCGYRSTCVWEGGAIQYLEENRVGWGNWGTLCSAALDGNANTASHKVYKFSDRLLRQYGRVAQVLREFDRVHRVSLKGGGSLRIGMIAEYEPTADAVRSLWERFGPVDIAWNINPNGNPTTEAVDAGLELGCEVLKWDNLKERMRTA